MYSPRAAQQSALRTLSKFGKSSGHKMQASDRLPRIKNKLIEFKNLILDLKTFSLDGPSKSIEKIRHENMSKSGKKYKQT